MRYRVRARADHGHVSLDHVEQLRKLIDTRPPQEASDPRNPPIISCRLHDRRPIFQNRHRPELINHELFAVKPFTALPEYDGTV